MIFQFLVFGVLLGALSPVQGWCGSALTGNTGTLQSPYYPRYYPNRAYCTWTITADPGTVITLTFSHFDLEYDSYCRYDSLSILDGNIWGSPTLARLCGRRLVNPITSTGNTLLLQFRTDGSVTLSGFQLQWSATPLSTDCSEELSGNLGWIESPNFPADYENRTKCDWVIRSDPGTEITLTFTDFDLPSSRLCTGDAVIVRDGPSNSDDLLARLCGSDDIPAFVRSSSNAMYVKFRSDRSDERQGFRAQWSANLDTIENLSGNTGTIKSPNYPNDYPNFAWNAWKITTDPGTQVVVSFLDFEIQSGEGCPKDYIVIHDGADRTATVLLKDCGFVAPAPITASSNVMYIEFRSNDRKTHAGFKLQWATTQNCYQSLSGTSGTIQSPNYPSNYSNNDQCVWTISTDPGYIISLDFPSLDIQDSHKCRSDFLVVRDGLDQFSTALDKVCGDSIPSPILSRGNQAFLFFHSDDTVTGSGFEINWSAISGCGGDVNGNSGWLESPNYPLDYYNRAKCEWVIRSDPGTQITLTFSAFDLPSSSQCSGDAVIVRDGDNDSAELLAKLCSTPGFVRSSSNVMYVKFRSDRTETRTGFRAAWSTTNDPAVVLTGNTGTIQSQNFPNDYPNFAWQAWQITSDPGTQITLSFVEFEMQSGDDCPFDYVVVYDGADRTANLLLKDCGFVAPAPVTSTGNVMYVEFRADEKKTHAGFQATWSTTPGCVYYVSGSSGTVQSPNYPSNYSSNSQCVWVITVDPSMQVKLEIPSVDLQYDDLCREDFLVIRDGGDQFASRLNKFCGVVSPPTVISRRNQMFIFFHTDDSVTGTGFSGTWTAIPGCSQELTGTGGFIQSPNYPSNYYNRARCEWVIRTDPGTQVQLKFTAFSLPYSYVCQSDAVSIYDGEDRSAKVLGKLCGSGRAPNIFISTSNAMTVKFRSDLSLTTSGFRAEWGVSQECSSNLTGSEGYIQSPNYPGLYPNMVACEWVIRSDPGTRITLSFIQNYLPYSSICKYGDTITIRDGDSASSNLLAEICRREERRPVRSTGNVIYVKFQSNAIYSLQGFRAFWTTREPCDYLLTGNTGVIQSPDYPSNYSINLQCSWLITTDPGTHVVLDFDDFDVQEDTYCNADRLSIYDGNHMLSRFLVRHCGSTLPTSLIAYKNHMFLHFKSDETGSGKGFKATWSTFAGCTETFNSNTGSFSSPNYPGMYQRGASCEWIIRSDPGTQITLTFSDFELQGSYYCNTDRVVIRDGDSSAATQLGRYCLTRDVVPLTSTGNVMYVSFHTSALTHGKRGFLAQWSTSPACVYDVTGSSGTIQSPYYPNNYTNSAQCLWRVSTAPGTHIVLDFITFDVEDSNSCTADSLAIHDGDDQYATRLKFLCGSALPQSVISTENELFVYFRTNHVGTATGFQAEWSIFQGCNANLSGNTGTFQSPNYPGNYPGSVTCEWVIRSDPGTNITLIFNEFQVIRSAYCVHDAVFVYDGEDATAQLLSKMCGYGDPVPITSTSNVMYVKFKTNAVYHAKGFQAEWSTDQGCMYDLTGNSGTIQSPNYPSDYPNNTQCFWIITTEPDSRAILSFTNFDLQYSYGCEADVVAIYQLTESWDTLPIRQVRRCGSTAPSVVRAGSNKMYVTFRSDDSVTSTGFQADWSLYEGCGTSLTGENGTITSPNYPSNYGHHEYCRWTITVESGKRVKLQFVHFDLEGSGGCVFDSLSIHDGAITKLCGSVLPNPYISRENVLVLQFTTDPSVTDTGFEIGWSVTDEY